MFISKLKWKSPGVSGHSGWGGSPVVREWPVPGRNGAPWRDFPGLTRYPTPPQITRLEGLSWRIFGGAEHG